jgi:hypothetical protein
MDEVKTVEKPVSIGNLLASAEMTPCARIEGALAIELLILLYYLGEIRVKENYTLMDA